MSDVQKKILAKELVHHPVTGEILLIDIFVIYVEKNRTLSRSSTRNCLSNRSRNLLTL